MEATPTENKQTEPLLGVKHKKHKWSDSLSFQSRLMIVFGLLLVLVLTIQGTATYIISRNLLLNYIDEMMLNSAEGVAKEIDLYTSAVNSREIMRKTVYLVQNERAAFVARGTPVQIDILDNRGGKVYTTEEVNGTSHLPDAARKKILGTREGINEVKNRFNSGELIQS
ncbi:hypothetical protein [Desulfoscipio geothermicus]|uniref:Uncharacterized protein n=1 Tax=Desulfoscipio geothermicus DSM 3669 TaxID=1121426 RepID=A0A1I6E797_9FIRM|nr:hypothetical protein [Desulfoscipio geothermicus]SFR13576.1 hypothetical protein SAMN05660706_12830 [Desulfoscipio geothermicus DSM 3669]